VRRLRVWHTRTGSAWTGSGRWWAAAVSQSPANSAILRSDPRRRPVRSAGGDECLGLQPGAARLLGPGMDGVAVIAPGAEHHGPSLRAVARARGASQSGQGGVVGPHVDPWADRQLGRHVSRGYVDGAAPHTTPRTPYAPRAPPRRCGRESSPPSSPAGSRNAASSRASVMDCWRDSVSAGCGT